MAELPKFCGRCGRDAASAPLCNHIQPPRGCLGRQIEAAARGAGGAEPSYAVADALRLVLLFHTGGDWTAERRAEWLRITGSTEATTKVLCDHVRSALALVGEPEWLPD
jgi:hypothetical protein